MKKLLLSVSLLVAGTSAVWAGSICPASSGNNAFPYNPDPTGTGCNVVITINPGGSISVALKDGNPYENSEDVLVGVINNSGTTIRSLNISGGAGSGIFGFDGDGICTFTFTGSGYCSNPGYNSDPLDYAGPTSTFSNYATGDSGTVNFNPGIPPSGTTYFSLEGVPTAALTGSATTGTGTVSAPALSTPAMVLLSMLLIGVSMRMLKQTA